MRRKGPASGRSSGSEDDQIAATRNLAKANREAVEADAHLGRARQAVAEAAHELIRLKSVEAEAVQRAKEARAQALQEPGKRSTDGVEHGSFVKSVSTTAAKGHRLGADTGADLHPTELSG